MSLTTDPGLIGSLPIFEEALRRGCPGPTHEAHPAGLCGRTELAPGTSGHPSRHGRGPWVMPIGMLEALAGRGRIVFALEHAFLVVFSDQVVAMQGFGPTGWARALVRSREADLEGDPAGIVRRAGDAWLAPGETGNRYRHSREDPASETLTTRLRDLLVATDAHAGTKIDARRGSCTGDEGGAQVVGNVSMAIRAFLVGAARHAVRRAGRSDAWRLHGMYPFLHLASCWTLTPATHRVCAPSDPGSATLRAIGRDRAISRTIDWLAATDAPRELLAAAYCLDPSRSGR